jgi:acyl-CoA dehydrogenase
MPSMDLGMSDRVTPIYNRVKDMIRNEIMPLDVEYEAEIAKAPDRWKHTKRMDEILETAKAKAKKEGLWNFFLTHSKRGYGLNTVEYAYLAEEMGWSRLAAQVFNCSAPDTGNMEVLEMYGNEAQKKQWLEPLLEGKIRSAFIMTEPNVGSSDATNIATEAKLEGNEWVINGEKWFSSGAGDTRCKIYIVMVKTSSDTSRGRHGMHSQILVPAGTKGVNILRPLTVYGHDHAPHGHMHVKFENVRVPKENMILGEGKGFEISQGRLGPGRIHHCMRAIGQAERALEGICKRSLSRSAFGEKLYKLGANYDIIAEARMEIEQARLLTLKAAWMMDNVSKKEARLWISQTKVVSPRMALKVIDEAVQMHGGMGVTQDTPFAMAWTHVRTLRLADGPDAVHRRVIGRQELRKHTNEKI